MKIDEFEKKHGLDFKGDTLEEMLFFTALDKLYLEFTPEQAAEIVKDFMVCADDIYNEFAERTQDTMGKLEKLFGKDPDNKKEFDA